MKRFKKFKSMNIIFLVLMLFMSQINIGAFQDDKVDDTLNDDKILEMMLDKEKIKTEVDETQNLDVDVEVEFTITDETWEHIEENDKKVSIKFPKDIKVENSDDDSNYEIEKDNLNLNFKKIETNPKTLTVNFSLLNILDKNILDDIKFIDYPILNAIKENLYNLMEENTIENDGKDEENDGKNEEKDPNESEKPSETETPSEPQNPVLPEEKPKLNIGGKISLKAQEQFLIKILDSKEAEVNSSNPINFSEYKDTNTIDGKPEYYFSLYSETYPNMIPLFYEVSLDDESLALITEDSIKDGLNFSILENGKQVPFKYSYDFPKSMNFHSANADSMSIGKPELSDYRISLLKRNTNSANVDEFSLEVEEQVTEISSEEAEIEIKEFHLQRQASLQISKFINDRLEKGVELEEIKKELKDGIKFLDETYKINGFKFVQAKKEDLANKIDYEYYVEDFLGMDQNLNTVLPIVPENGKEHELNADKIEEISGGFKITWDGMINTDRKQVLGSLRLRSTEPNVVENNDIKSWDIKTKVVIDYYEVLNNGELRKVDIDQFVVEETEKPMDFVIDLPKQNIVGKYHVEQTYTNKSAEIEVEGIQTFKLNANMNGGKATGAQISKTYPSSLIMSALYGDESRPTSLVWNITFNNNKLIRQSGSGFVFDIKDKVIDQLKMGKDDSQLVKNKTLEINDEFSIKIKVDGKALEEDGRFEYHIDSETKQIKLILKEGKTVDKEVKVEISYTYTNKEDMRTILFDNVKTGLEAEANIKSYSKGNIIEPSHEIKAKSRAVLSVLDKKPIMIDYRTNEIIWGVKINTATAQRLDLPGLTYIDKLGEGLSLENISDEHKVMLFKLKQGKGNYNDFNKFISEASKLMNGADVYAKEVPNLISGMMSDVINPKPEGEKEDSKTYADAIEFVNPSDIFYLNETNDKTKYNDESYIYSEPKGQKLEMPSVIQEGAPGRKQKGDLLKDNDLRLDFVKSNQFASNPSGTSDDNAYYFVYKTRLVNETATASVKNDAKITYARYVLGEGNQYEWVTPGMSSKKDLDDVGKYNTAPHKTSKRITAKDESGRLRHAVEWNIKFNYDVLNEKEVGKYTAKITDTISKNVVEGKLSNVHLEVEEINELALNTYTVDKSGKLISTGNKVTLNQDEFTLIDNDEKIELSFEKELDPQYVYEFSFTTYVNADELILESGFEENSEQSKLALSGKVDNVVKYERKYGVGAYAEPTTDESSQDLELINRVSKSGRYTSNNTSKEPSAPKSNQEVIWTLEFNDTQEVMNNLKLTDELIGKHSYNILSSSNDFDKDPIAKLHNLKIQIKEGNVWKKFDKYTLTSVNGKTDENLDDWITGESGFIINFTETVDKPLRITYSSYGHVVDKEELPLKNNAVIEYSTINNSKHKHKVVAQADFAFTSTGEYNEKVLDLNLNLRYDDNKIHSTSEINHGNPLTKEGVESVYAVLYRYEKNNVDASYIYRAGKFDQNGNITFKDVEEGRYIVKQLHAPKGYYISNDLGFALSDRNTNKDKAYPLTSENEKNLVYVDVKEEKGLFSIFKNPAKEVDAAIYNLTPSIEISKKGVLKDDSIRDVETALEGIRMDVVKKDNDATSKLDDSEYITNQDGIISIGKGKDYDIELNFNTFEISEKAQELNGYLHNTETKTLTVERNPSGTLVNNSDKLIFSNYKVNAEIKNIDREKNSTVVKNSEFELFKKESGKLIPYKTAVSKQKVKDNLFRSNGGSLYLYNLDIGQYELKQVKAGDNYLINPVNLKFDVYNGKNYHEGKPEVMKFDFENVKADLNVKNILENDFIAGSGFEIIDENNKRVTRFSISNADSGFTQKIAPGKYKLRQISTSDNLPLRKLEIDFNIESTEAVFENETEKNIRNLVYENHLGTTKIHTHTSSQGEFDIKSFDLGYKGNTESHGSVTEIRSLRSGEHTLSNFIIDKEWIYVNTNPKFTIISEYVDAKELDTDVHLYASKAYLNYKNIDGDTNDEIIYDEATFRLIKENNELELSNDQGEFLFSELSPGKYSLEQSKAPQLYGRNTDVIKNIEVVKEINEDNVEINKEKHTVGLYELESQVFKNYRGKVELIKTSAESKEVLPGVHFDLYYENELLEKDLITDDQGKISLDLLSPGNYKFVETKSDGNHVISTQESDELEFEVEKENSGAYYTSKLGYENHYADIIFRNINPDGSIEYQDSSFKLETKESGNWETLLGYEDIVFDDLVDSNYFVISGLKIGEYRLVQTKAPNKTIHNLAPLEFAVEENLGLGRNVRPYKEITPFVNYQGNVKIDIKDMYGLVDHEVEVNLVHENSEIEYSLEQDGSNLFADLLEPGKYSVEVIKSNLAIIVDEEVNFEITTAAINDEDIQANEEIRLSYAFKNIILKDGRNEKVLNSGSFDLNDEKMILSGDQIRVENIAPGEYKLKQSKAAESYILNALNHEEFTVKDKISEYENVETDSNDYPYIELDESEYLNYQQNLIVNKVDENNQLLEGVEFTLSNGVVMNTDDKGQAKFMDLSPGSYVLEESKTIEGYQLLEDKYEFVVLEEAEGKPSDLEVTIINNKIVEEEKPSVKPEKPTDKPTEKPNTNVNDDSKEPMIPGLGMSNTTMYLALFSLAVGALILYISKKSKDEMK